MSSLTPDQTEFLTAKRVPLSKVFDASGMSNADYQAVMKTLGAWIAFNVTPCGKAGHTLRTRKGHCVQCDPAKIGFMSRHDKDAMVYVAHSSRRHYTKVGSAEDPDLRIKSLNGHRYGQIDDWKLIFSVKCERAGDVEFRTHAALIAHHMPRKNAEGANSIQSRELFACDPEVAIEAIKAAIVASRARA